MPNPGKAGDRLRISARQYNSAVKAGEAHNASQLSRTCDRVYRPLPAGQVWLKNTTANDRARFEILGLGDPLFTPTENADEFKSSIAFKGAAPSFASHFGGLFFVLLEPISAGDVGLAIIQGIANVQIDVKDADHEFADIEDAATDTLRSYCAGSARILWKESGTGDKWARVLLGAMSVKLWRFTLNAAFSGSPSTAAADLLNMDGTDTGQDVTVRDELDVFSADLGNGDAGYCCQVGTLYHAIQAPCP
jgi:hypothetical protein